MSASKRRAILHIGVGKTGTTSIQARLKNAREELLRRGYHYPQTWGPQHHSQLVQIMEPARRGALETEEGEEPELPPAEAVAASIAAELEALPAHVHSVVFSSELLYGSSLVRGGVERLKAMLDAHFDRYVVICYIRRQDERAVSGYSTLLKDGRTGTDPLDLSETKLRTLDYTLNLAPWTEAFGLDAMLVRVYEREALLGGDVVTDFLRVTGIGHLETPEGEAPRNPSLSAPALDFLRRVNEAMQADKPAAAQEKNEVVQSARGRRSQRLRRALVQQFAGAGQLPARSRAEAFYARFHASNAELLARFFPGHERLFTEDFSRYPEAERRPTEAEVLAVATAVTLALLRDLERLTGADLLRRARDAVAGNDPAQARPLLVKAIAEGDLKTAREAQEVLASLPMDAEAAARVKWRMNKGANARAQNAKPAEAAGQGPQAGGAKPGGPRPGGPQPGGARPGGPGPQGGGTRPAGPGPRADGAKSGGPGPQGGGAKPGGPGGQGGGAKPGGPGAQAGGAEPGGPGPRAGGAKPGGPGPRAGGAKPGGPGPQAGGARPGGPGPQVDGAKRGGPATPQRDAGGPRPAGPGQTPAPTAGMEAAAPPDAGAPKVTG